MKKCGELDNIRQKNPESEGLEIKFFLIEVHSELEILQTITNISELKIIKKINSN